MIDNDTTKFFLCKYWDDGVRDDGVRDGDTVGWCPIVIFPGTVNLGDDLRFVSEHETLEAAKNESIRVFGWSQINRMDDIL